VTPRSAQAGLDEFLGLSQGASEVVRSQAWANSP
jgi:hypothetical protein